MLTEHIRSDNGCQCAKTYPEVKLTAKDLTRKTSITVDTAGRSDFDYMLQYYNQKEDSMNPFS